jgi:hypothetical protein
MSTGSGALRVPGAGVSRTRVAIGAVVLAGIVTGAALWTVRDGSETAEPVGSRPQVAQTESARPGGGFEGAVQQRVQLSRGKQLGVDVGSATAFGSGTEAIAARVAMLASYQEASMAELVATRNAMLASYQDARNDEIVVNGEVCQICWKYR